MNPPKKIVAICGSTRGHSTNHSIIMAIKGMFSGRIDLAFSMNVADIPQFNPDLDTDDPPQAVAGFRKQLREAVGILICTPEYAMGVPGSLKNAIDWTVSSMEFSHKPVALITASSVGQKGHASLLETLKIIESQIPGNSQLLISHARTKVKDDEIVDEPTRKAVKATVESLLLSIK